MDVEVKKNILIPALLNFSGSVITKFSDVHGKVGLMCFMQYFVKKALSSCDVK